MIDEYTYDRAWSCYKRGQINQAIELIKQVLAENPTDAASHGLLALCLLQERRIYAAEYEIQLALNENTEEPFFYIVLAQIHILKNKPNKALDFCDEALRLNPENIEALLLKADIFSLLENDKETLRNINEAAKIEPNHLEIKLAYGNYYLNKGKLDKAFVYAQDAIRQNPQSVDCNILMGKLKLKEGDIKEALNLAKYAIIQNPDSEQALKLFSDIKTRENWFLGLWWRFNSKMSTLSGTKASIVLISMFLFFNLLAQVLEDLGFVSLAKIFTYGWLILVLYSWIGLPLYKKKLNEELSKFRFNDDY